MDILMVIGLGLVLAFLLPKPISPIVHLVTMILGMGEIIYVFGGSGFVSGTVSICFMLLCAGCFFLKMILPW